MSKDNMNQHKRMAMGEKVTGMAKGGKVGHADAKMDAKALKAHADMPASKAHRGLAKGGKVC
jgi:hypothetical protein